MNKTGLIKKIIIKKFIIQDVEYLLKVALKLKGYLFLLLFF